MTSNPVRNPHVEDPDNIRNLLNPGNDAEFYFVFGEKTKNIPKDKIGVKKEMLMKHSEVFRIQMGNNPLKTEKEIAIEDIFPDTFRNLLRYVYRHDITGFLSVVAARDLLYAADKYMIEDLKKSLVSRLHAVLSPENVCSVMDNLNCCQVEELHSQITRILRLQTKQVLASPQFLELSPDAFLFILNQALLNVPEIELWRSAIKWATKRANSADGTALRKELTPLLPHIRVLAVPYKDFCKDIKPTGVLTDAETEQIHLYHQQKNYKAVLKGICDIDSPRMQANFEKLQSYLTTKK